VSNVEDKVEKVEDVKVEKKKRRGCSKIVLLLIGGIVLACIFIFAIAEFAPGPSISEDMTARAAAPRPTSVAEAEEDTSESAAPVSEETAVPVGVSEQVDTPEATATPAPTATPNLAPPISVFLDNYEKMTDAQWEKFSDEVSGSYIDQWEGEISQVDAGEIFGGYDMYIDVTDEEFGSEVFIGDIPEDLALAFNKNQPVLFSGVVKFASNSFGMSIYLDKDTVVIEPIDNDATR